MYIAYKQYAIKHTFRACCYIEATHSSFILGPYLNDIYKVCLFWTPSPLVSILARFIVPNSRNLPHYVCIWVPPLPSLCRRHLSMAPYGFLYIGGIKCNIKCKNFVLFLYIFVLKNDIFEQNDKNCNPLGGSWVHFFECHFYRVIHSSL